MNDIDDAYQNALDSNKRNCQSALIGAGNETITLIRQGERPPDKGVVLLAQALEVQPMSDTSLDQEIRANLDRLKTTVAELTEEQRGGLKAQVEQLVGALRKLDDLL